MIKAHYVMSGVYGTLDESNEVITVRLLRGGGGHRPFKVFSETSASSAAEQGIDYKEGEQKRPLGHHFS